ncbi:NAD(P)-binding protein [Leucogyrophana mollusca]|uniref:NAD(P)-binding protein n=1 Tax=Leucogyrophana mollusca TaxID=85980 RepID=A0ACB8BVX5_9AGAM|nr:NAD(P)-binding protein [Leucogyrophana mollusca]
MADVVLDRLAARRLFDLRGVVAVITGGGTGIGLMMSTTLMANGATVYIIGPKQEELDNIAKVYNDAATESSGRMYGLEGDVRQKSEAKRLAEEVGKREKYVTVLFNNAGILAAPNLQGPDPTASSFVSAYFDSVSQDDFNNVFNTNAVGTYWLSIAFLPLLEKWKNADPVDNPAVAKFVPQIIVTSSGCAWTKVPLLAARSFPYMFSKSASGQFVSSLAHELLPLGIRVNGIAPGYFQSELSAPGTADTLGHSHATLAMLPPLAPPDVPTGGTPRDIGALALFLLANWFVNGETVLIDGGTFLVQPSSY